jgi:hypothetical protein
MDALYEWPSSPLRGVSEVPHAISGLLQPIWQRVLSRTAAAWIFAGIHFVLFVRYAMRVQPVEANRIQKICDLESSL